MCGKKLSTGKVYRTYRPYPVSNGSENEDYSSLSPDTSQTTRNTDTADIFLDGFPDLIGDPSPQGSFTSKPVPSNDDGSLRPLHLLRSLFTDRLNFLQRALDELESAKLKRQRLAEYALKELDPEISKCELALSVLGGMANKPERSHQLERRLFELKRERRREALLSWRDLVSLKREIINLQREIDSLNRTSDSAENRDAPL